MARQIHDLLQKDVSITTVKDLRYEGKLYSYNLADYTITLQDVRSFGTENRVSDIQVPPSNNVYDYIVFSASQVQSFHPIQKEAHIKDPAIIEVIEENSPMTGPRQSRQSPKKLSSMMSRGQSTIMDLFNSGSHVRSIDVNLLMSQGSSNKSNQTRGGQRRQGGNARGQANQNAGGNMKGNRGRNQKQQDENSRGATEGGRRKNKKQQNQNNSPSKSSRHVSFKTDSAGQRNERRHFSHIPQVPRSILSKQNRRQDSGKAAPNSPHRPRSSSTPGSFPNPKTPLKQFDEDFDFEQAQEKFKELSLSGNKKDDKDKKADGEAKTPDESNKDGASSDSTQEPKGPAYDQVKDFYDNLSMTIESDGQQRLSRREMMMTNKETFGTTHVPGRRSFFRGYQRSSGPNHDSNRRSRSAGRRYISRQFRRPQPVY